jgi:tRNA A37 threonylcarbamoyladenosine synthetase subunit TsaC/SUA5/YrdC
MTESEKLIKSILAGKVFIYPTDTIGIGCDATNKRAVEKIKQIKQGTKINRFL